MKLIRVHWEKLNGFRADTVDADADVPDGYVLVQQGLFSLSTADYAKVGLSYFNVGDWRKVG